MYSTAVAILVGGRGCLPRLGVYQGGVCPGLCLLRGVSAQAGCLPRGCLPRAVSAQRGVCPGWVSTKGVSAPGCVCSEGCLPRLGVYQGGVCPGVCLLRGVSAIYIRYNIQAPVLLSITNGFCILWFLFYSSV